MEVKLAQFFGEADVVAGVVVGTVVAGVVVGTVVVKTVVVPLVVVVDSIEVVGRRLLQCRQPRSAPLRASDVFEAAA